MLFEKSEANRFRWYPGQGCQHVRGLIPNVGSSRDCKHILGMGLVGRRMSDIVGWAFCNAITQCGGEKFSAEVRETL